MDNIVASAMAALEQGEEKLDWIVDNYGLMLDYSVEELNNAWKEATMYNAIKETI